MDPTTLKALRDLAEAVTQIAASVEAVDGHLRASTTSATGLARAAHAHLDKLTRNYVYPPCEKGKA